jgi:Undecaprenyl-phosphate galactose phosphotransferase WbaP
MPLKDAGEGVRDLAGVGVRSRQLDADPSSMSGEFERILAAVPETGTFDELGGTSHFASEHRIETAVIEYSAAQENGIFERSSPRLVVSPVLDDFDTEDQPATSDLVINNGASQTVGRAAYRIWKRALDLLIALSAGLVLLPLILVIAAAVKITSSGNVFYGHLRVGRNNTRFRVWKFRTMVSDADTLLAERLATDPSLRMEWDRDQKLRKDPRVTPIGNLLRRVSLDELPQLWNVIKGEMSIVGPRPISEAEIPKYGEYFADFTKAVPGISGLWQVSGRNLMTYPQRVYLDAYYVNNWTLLLDFRIMLLTIKALLTARGAY